MSSVDTTIQLIRAGRAAGTVCSPDLAEGPWVFDRQTEPSYGPGSSMCDIIPAGSPRQGQLPQGILHRVHPAARRPHPRREADTRRVCRRALRGVLHGRDRRHPRRPTAVGDPAEPGRIVCTSSNAATVLAWALERGQRVLFFPDQHLGRNTARAMGVPLEHMPMWNPRKPLGGNSDVALADARVILCHSSPRRAGAGRVQPGERSSRLP